MHHGQFHDEGCRPAYCLTSTGCSNQEGDSQRALASNAAILAHWGISNYNILAQERLRQAAFALSVFAAVIVIVSGAASQIALGLALAAYLAARQRLRMPPLKLPLLLFIGVTLISAALSWNPWAGWPAVKKFYLFALLPVVFTAVAVKSWFRQIAALWVLVGTASAVVGLGQLVVKWRQAEAVNAPFYDSYVSDRITGFMSLWMTFSGQLMMVFLLGTAWLLFAPPRGKWRWALGASVILTGAAILASYTRGVWIATGVGLLFLAWKRNRWLVLVMPLVLAALIAVGPQALRARFTSIVTPHGELDSNSHREVCYRTGIRMIAAHPWIGTGPELAGPDLLNHLPPDIVPPLPEGWYGHLHNIYLQYAAERGIFALAAVVWLLAKILWDLARGVRQLTGFGRALVLGAIAVHLAVATGGLFEFNLGDSEVLSLYLAMVAAGYAQIEGKTGNHGTVKISGG